MYALSIDVQISNINSAAELYCLKIPDLSANQFSDLLSISLNMKPATKKVLIKNFSRTLWRRTIIRIRRDVYIVGESLNEERVEKRN